MTGICMGRTCAGGTRSRTSVRRTNPAWDTIDPQSPSTLTLHGPSTLALHVCLERRLLCKRSTHRVLEEEMTSTVEDKRTTHCEFGGIQSSATDIPDPSHADIQTRSADSSACVDCPDVGIEVQKEHERASVYRIDRLDDPIDGHICARCSSVRHVWKTLAQGASLYRTATSEGWRRP